MYCDIIKIEQGDVEAIILYSFSIKEISKDPITARDFDFSRCLNNNDFFKNLFDLYGNKRIQYLLEFVFIIIYERI